VSHFDDKVIVNRNSAAPRISIVTPSYNQGEFLERTILSVLNQNYPNLEYIIIDGGSTDGSVDIIRRYEKYLAYWISENDEGQSDAINKGFSQATGQICAYLNSDDIYLPGIFCAVAEFFEKNPGVSLVYGNKLIIDGDDNVISERRVTRYTCLSKIGFAYGGFGVYQPASFWTKTIFDLSGGVNPSLRFCMDNDLFYRFLEYGAEFRFIRRYFSGFRVHQRSKTSTLSEVAKAETSFIIQEHNLKHNSLIGKCIRFFVRAHRILLFVIQGDIDYLFFRAFEDKLKWVP